MDLPQVTAFTSAFFTPISLDDFESKRREAERLFNAIPPDAPTEPFMLYKSYDMIRNGTAKKFTQRQKDQNQLTMAWALKIHFDAASVSALLSAVNTMREAKSSAVGFYKQNERNPIAPEYRLYHMDFAEETSKAIPDWASIRNDVQNQVVMAAMTLLSSLRRITQSSVDKDGKPYAARIVVGGDAYWMGQMGLTNSRFHELTEGYTVGDYKAIMVDTQNLHLRGKIIITIGLPDHPDLMSNGYLVLSPDDGGEEPLSRNGKMVMTDNMGSRYLNVVGLPLMAEIDITWDHAA